MVGTDGIPVDADASDESDSVSRLRRRHAEEIERLAARHERQLDALKSSSRYQIGDALINAVRSPRHIGRSFRQLRALFTNRSPKPSPLPPLAPVDSPNSSVAIGAVLDEFSWSCFANEAALVELRPDTATTDVDGLDLVLVESAWEGNRGQWTYLVNGASTLEPLKELVRACAERDVPAVFWNKEDPVGFDAVHRCRSPLSDRADHRCRFGPAVSRHHRAVGGGRLAPVRRATPNAQSRRSATTATAQGVLRRRVAGRQVPGSCSTDRRADGSRP